jgi:hypothetical protein
MTQNEHTTFMTIHRNTKRQWGTITSRPYVLVDVLVKLLMNLPILQKPSLPRPHKHPHDFVAKKPCLKVGGLSWWRSIKQSEYVSNNLSKSQIGGKMIHWHLLPVNHVMWSRTHTYNVKSYVSRPSTKRYFNEMLFMRVLTHDKIE